MPMNDVMRIDEIPEDTQCRKVTTQMETKSGGKKSEIEGRQQEHERVDPVPDGRRLETRLSVTRLRKRRLCQA